MDERKDDDTLCDKFRVGMEIGKGTFGRLHLALDMETNELFAAKREPMDAKYMQLPHEAKLYELLSGGIGIPKFIWFGSDDFYNVMVIELLGRNLQDILKLCGGKFSLKTVLMLADQFIDRVEFIHEKGIIHRDIKPNNFLMGLKSKQHMVHLIDFGLSKQYIDPETQKHIPYREDKGIVGSVCYASLNTHSGIEHSRRDDLQSIGYMLMYFLRGWLPWQGIEAYTKWERYDLIAEEKADTPIMDICQTYPSEFESYFYHIDSLGFEDKPDYSYLKKLFRDVFTRKGYQWDYMYDWIVVENPGLKSTPELNLNCSRRLAPTVSDGWPHQIEAGEAVLPANNDMAEPVEWRYSSRYESDWRWEPMVDSYESCRILPSPNSRLLSAQGIPNEPEMCHDFPSDEKSPRRVLQSPTGSPSTPHWSQSETETGRHLPSDEESPRRDLQYPTGSPSTPHWSQNELEPRFRQPNINFNGQCDTGEDFFESGTPDELRRSEVLPSSTGGPSSSRKPELPCHRKKLNFGGQAVTTNMEDIHEIWKWIM